MGEEKSPRNPAETTTQTLHPAAPDALAQATPPKSGICEVTASWNQPTRTVVSLPQFGTH